MRTTAQRLLLTLPIVILLACKDQGPSVAVVAGTYTLRSIDGFSLPYTTAVSSIRADTIELHEDQTYERTMWIAVGNSSTPVPLRDVGNWTLEKRTLHCVGASDMNFDGTVSGDQITVKNPGTLVYRKL